MMRRQVAAILVAAFLAGSAKASDNRHDERLARAAAEIAASRMGELRGGLDIGARPILVEPMANLPRPSAQLKAPRDNVWDRGLAIAVERKSSASPDL